MNEEELIEVINGEFKSNNITYIVTPVTKEISRITKNGSNSFSMLGKVVFEGDNTGLLVFTDKDSAFVIKNIISVYCSTRKLAMETLEYLPELIAEAESSNISLIEQPRVTMPNAIVVKKIL